MNKRLAIVVPFYKLTFFRALLEALANQTDKRFTVYIGDDCSQSDPMSDIESFRDRLHIVYQRFSSRRGHLDLAAQWNRCTALTLGEDWVWVVPDDDLPSRECVQRIYGAMNDADRAGIDLLHVPYCTADREGRILDKPFHWPGEMPVYTFYLRQLKGEGGGMSLGNCVFRQRVLTEIGGFVSFPQGWGSDHATALAVAAGRRVLTINGVWLAFRMSGENISSSINDGLIKMKARRLFASWLNEKSQLWFSSAMTANMMPWFYLKGEHYVVNVWPLDPRIFAELFRLATTCGVPRNTAQKCGVIVRALLAALSRRQQT